MKSISNNLDGNRHNIGQGQGGNLQGINDMVHWLRNVHFSNMSEYVSDDELIIMWNDEHVLDTIGMTPYEKIQHSDRVAAIYDKIPMDFILQQNEARLKLSRAKKAVTHAGYQLGAREFTLTYSPKWFSDNEAKAKMIMAIEKLCKYYRDEIVQLRAVGEVGTNGLSHIHCFYKLRGGLKITDKNFKRAWPHWNPKIKLGSGFEGGHHACVKSESDFMGYIDKDVETAWMEKMLP